MIATQFERLAPADQSLLRAASVAGIEFAAQAIAAPLRLRRRRRRSALRDACALQRFLRVAGDSAWPDGSVARRYAFTHELYRQAVYEGTSAGSRQRLHQRVGEALEAAYGERATEIAGELATHFERGRDYPRALRYLAAAAARARQRFAGREAIAYLEAAIALAARLPDEGERRRRELELRFALAPIQSDLAGPASEKHAGELRAGLRVSAGRSAIRRSSSRSSTRSLTFMRRAPTRPGRSTSWKSSTSSHGAWERSSTACWWTAPWCVSQRYHGRYNDARRIAEGPLSAYLHGEGSQHPLVSGADPVIDANCSYAYALWFLGYIDRALATMRDSVARAERPDVPPLTKAAALTQMAALELLQRNPAEVRRVAGQAVDRRRRTWISLLERNCGGAARLGARPPGRGAGGHPGTRGSARRASRRREPASFPPPSSPSWPRPISERANMPPVWPRRTRACGWPRQHSDRSYWPELWRLKGELLLAASAANRGRTPRRRRAPAGEESRWEEGEACLRRALDMARETEAKSLELRAAASLARMLQARGRTADACALLEGICAWFGADATSPDLVEARVLLQQLSAAAR